MCRNIRNNVTAIAESRIKNDVLLRAPDALTNCSNQWPLPGGRVQRRLGRPTRLPDAARRVAPCWVVISRAISEGAWGLLGTLSWCVYARGVLLEVLWGEQQLYASLRCVVRLKSFDKVWYIEESKHWVKTHYLLKIDIVRVQYY